MGDSNFSFPLALKWDLGPDRLRNLKNKLLLHFQSKKRSNGGECEIQDSAIIQGYVLIHFKEQEVRDSVLQKETQVLALPGGKTMQLEVKPADAAGTPVACNASVGMQSAVASVRGSGGGAGSITPESSSNVVLMKNVLNSCSSEMLNLLVENISEMTEDKDFYVEMIPEIHCATVTFTSDIDVCSFIEKLLKNPRVRQLDLKAEPLERTRTIRAEGLPPNTSADHLIIYFESPKHGGGRVNKTKMLPEEEAALVTFTDAQTVAVILSMTHTFGKKPISVFPYYPCYDIALYGRQILSIDKPQPCTFPISPYILEFILSNADLKHNIEENMMAKHCEIIWPNLSSPSLDITLSFPGSLATHLRTMVKIVRTWKEEVSTEFSLVISRFKVIDCKVTPAVWEAIKEQVSSSSYRGVFIKANLAEEKVFLAGILKDVTRMESSFRELVEETTRHIERKKRCVSKPVAVSLVLYQIMRNSGQEKKILDETPELEMKYDVKAKAIILTGVQEEVLSAKAEILDVKHELKSKTIHLNQHIVRFLMSTDNEELSILLFVHHHINALVEMEENAVKLTGYSKKDLTEAEEQINREIIYRQIPVTDKKVLEMPEWKSLYSHLCESYNAERCAVLIEEFPMGAEQDVVVTGLITPTLKCYQEVHDFLETNTPIQTTIPVRSGAAMVFLIEDNKKIWEMLKENVKVELNRDKVSLTGPKTHVAKASSIIQNILSLAHCDVLRIVKPGADKFCRSNNEIYVTVAKTKFNCVLYLETEGDDHGHECQIALPHGMSLSVYKGDLCRHHVDVIVNAANEELKHIGGLALAILKAAGPKLQADCDAMVRKHGKVSVGDAVITDAGNLPCKQVIHTVGPRWNPDCRSRCERHLRDAIASSLELASEKSHTSIAIPAVSSGVFGFPIKPCVEIIMDSIKRYAESQGAQSSVRTIHLLDSNVETVKIFSQVAKATFGVNEVGVLTAPEPKNPKKDQEKPQSSVHQESVATKEGLIIRILHKNIEEATTDVIVNSVGDDLRLDRGRACAALYKRAGSEMQRLLDVEGAGAPGAPGSIYQTDGCNLSCKKVFHVVTPQWDRGQGSAEKIFRAMVKQCLAQTEHHGWRSMSFPAIGTGQLQYPKDLAAGLMFDEIFLFSCRNTRRSLQEIHLLLHPNDGDTIKAFSSHLATMVSGAPRDGQASSAGTITCGPVTRTSLGVYQMMIGPVTFQVKTGDITTEDAGIIVNSSNDNFTLRTGVSKAILEAAGAIVEADATMQGSKPHKGYIVTSPGNLVLTNGHCQWILHLVGPKQPADIKKNVLDTLQECEKKQVSSVAFPALGTGAGRLSAVLVADTILETLMEFVQSKTVKSLQIVKVVIFQQNMLNDFHNSMKNKEGTAIKEHKSLVSKIADFIFPGKPKRRSLPAFHMADNMVPVTFSLCAEDKQNVDGAKAWLREQIERQQETKVMTEEWISEMEAAEMEKISDLQRRFQVSVTYKPSDSSFLVSGLTKDVMQASGEIQSIINGVRDRRTRERAAELTGNLVEWRYQSGSSTIAFDLMANLDLEEGRSLHKADVTVHTHGRKFSVQVQRESASDAHGNAVKIQRVVKHEQSSFSLPAHWTAMGSSLVTVEDVPAGSSQYLQIHQMFTQSCRSSILKVERIQNKDLWMNYVIKKQHINARNGSTNNERRLFHGTDINSIQHVNNNGFNRGFAGRNAAAFGNGTYFAVNAKYSASSNYSVPDPRGQKHMYLARVLTGLYCQGQAGMVTPPPKNPLNPTDLYDSVTDNVASPSMFVIFNDIQAYPEYHITFC